MKVEALLCFTFVLAICLNLPDECLAGYCQQPYQCTRTCYRTQSAITGCGLLDLFGCSKYTRTSYECTHTCNRQVCCEGFTGDDCNSPLCYGSTECPNGGKCVSPDNCTCVTGFHAPKCADINECASNNGGCEQTCVNTNGSFHCECLTGYQLASNTKTCIEINECNNNRGGCEQTCTNTPGSFTCGCNTGYSINKDGTTCSDIDECAANTAGCDHYCTNNIGSFICSCRPGYALGNDGKTCNEIDECLVDNGNCSQVCENNPGSYSCKCRTGYTIQTDGRSCIDVDECSVGISDCQQVCINTPGSYTCNCGTGYQLNKDGRTCTDIDGCASVDCQHGGACIDGIASYTCQCTPSFIGSHCETDVDECSFLNGGCEDVCTNTFGSYSCGCSGNGTLNSDGKSCKGDQESESVFRKYNIPNKLLPRGCSEIVLTKCTDGEEITISLSSTSAWYALKSNRQIVYTYGIVFAEVNSLAIPISIPGVEVNMADGNFEITLGARAFTDDDGDLVGTTRTGDCWQFDVTSRDVLEFIESSSFLKSLFDSLLESLPDWIQLKPTNDTNFDVQGLTTKLTYGRDMDNVNWCKGAPVLDDHLYSVFLFDTSFNVSVYSNPVEIPKPLSQKQFCLVVDLCHNYGGSVFLMIPNESRSQFSDIDVFRKLHEHSGIQIIPHGIGLSVVRGITVLPNTASLTFWNGDHTFEYPVFERANVWIGGSITANYPLGSSWPISPGVQVQASADMFISIPSLNRLLTAMFIDEWNALFQLRAELAPTLTLQLFGERHQLKFPDLVDLKTNVQMSVGGLEHRTLCGETSNPPGLFLSTVIRINPFLNVPVLQNWVIENTNTFYAYFMKDAAYQIADDFKVDIKDCIIQNNERVKRLEHLLITNTGAFENGSTIRSEIVHLKELVGRMKELSEDGLNSEDSFLSTIDTVTEIWKLYRDLDRTLYDFFGKIEHFVDVARDNFTSLLQYEKQHLMSSTNAVVQKLTDQVSLATQNYFAIGWKYTTTINFFGCKIAGVDIEFVISKSGIGHCSRFSKVYKLLEGQPSIRFLGRLSTGISCGFFLTLDKGIGIGGALALDHFRLILQLNAYISMLGIKITGDVFISEKGLYFFMEGNVWNRFLAQIDVSAEHQDDWYKLIFKLEGRFIAKARKRRQTQTDPSSFQASYLDALNEEVRMISDEVKTRITQAQEALDAANKELTKAQTWLDEKKEEFEKAHGKFDAAIESLEGEKKKLENAKEPFERAIESLNNAKLNVDNLCKIKDCEFVCIPGIECSICYKHVNIPHPCCKQTSCMIRIKDPVCIAKNLVCQGVRYVAYAALEAAEIFVKAPMVAFDVAKAGVSVAQFIVDKSKVVVDLAERVLDLAKLGLEGAKGLLNVAKGSLEAVKIVVGAAFKVLEFVIENGLKNVIDVKNCMFSIELSTYDLPVFDVSCEVNAFKLGWKTIRMRINFKNAFQTIWQAAKATIQSIMKQFNVNLTKRSIQDITYKSTVHMHRLMRLIRQSEPDNLNSTNMEDFFNETIDIISEMDGSETLNDYDNRVLLFKDKCTRISNILNFFNNTFELLHDIVNESVSNFKEIGDVNDQLTEFEISNVVENVTLDDAGISEEYAMNDYNITKEELDQALRDAKASFMNDQMLIEISKSANFTKGILDSELKSVESLNVISQWILAMENVTGEYFDETECVDFRDCIFHSVSMLYDIHAAESLPNINQLQNVISSIEDNILELFQNTSDNIRDIYNTSSLLSENIKNLQSMNLFCSEAPSFLGHLGNVTAVKGDVARLTCHVQANPDPVYWWYKDTEMLEVEMDQTLVIVNVSEADEGVYRCMAGNVVANISSNEARIIVKEAEWTTDSTIEAEGTTDSTIEAEVTTDSTIECSKVSCAPISCKPGYVSQTTPGECCPECVLECSKVLCALISCKPGYVSQTTPGECCPECVLDCSFVKCAKPECDDAYVPEGECCPICPGLEITLVVVISAVVGVLLIVSIVGYIVYQKRKDWKGGPAVEERNYNEMVYGGPAKPSSNDEIEMALPDKSLE